MSDSSPDPCPFCAMPAERIVEAREHAFAVLDAYPVSPGHTLAIARRHVPDVFDLTADEIADILHLIRIRPGPDRPDAPADGIQHRGERRPRRGPDRHARPYPHHSPLSRGLRGSDGRRPGCDPGQGQISVAGPPPGPGPATAATPTRPTGPAAILADRTVPTGSVGRLPRPAGPASFSIGVPPSRSVVPAPDRPTRRAPTHEAARAVGPPLVAALSRSPTVASAADQAAGFGPSRAVGSRLIVRGRRLPFRPGARCRPAASDVPPSGPGVVESWAAVAPAPNGGAALRRDQAPLSAAVALGRRGGRMSSTAIWPTSRPSIKTGTDCPSAKISGRPVSLRALAGVDLDPPVPSR